MAKNRDAGRRRWWRRDGAGEPGPEASTGGPDEEREEASQAAAPASEAVGAAAAPEATEQIPPEAAVAGEDIPVGAPLASAAGDEAAEAGGEAVQAELEAETASTKVAEAAEPASAEPGQEPEAPLGSDQGAAPVDVETAPVAEAVVGAAGTEEEPVGPHAAAGGEQVVEPEPAVEATTPGPEPEPAAEREPVVEASTPGSEPEPAAEREPVVEAPATQESEQAQPTVEVEPAEEVVADRVVEAKREARRASGRVRAVPSRGGGAAAGSRRQAPTPPPHEEALPMELPRVVAVANQKGGVGKTTTAVNLGAALAEAGFRVLVVDLDPQGNATTGLGLNPRDVEGSIYDVLMSDLPMEDAVEPTSLKNLFVVPATIDLAGAEIELVPLMSRELKLKRSVDAVRDQYDIILIDCPPSLGLLTVNGLAAADDVIVPIQCEYYALEGLGQLLRNVGLVQSNLNPTLDVRGIVLTMYDARTKLADQVETEVREYFGPKVYRTVVPRTVRLSEAPSFGQPIILFDSTSRGAQAYRELAKEVSRGATRRAG